jgi:hypothetical protein
MLHLSLEVIEAFLYLQSDEKIKNPSHSLVSLLKIRFGVLLLAARIARSKNRLASDIIIYLREYGAFKHHHLLSLLYGLNS